LHKLFIPYNVATKFLDDYKAWHYEIRDGISIWIKDSVVIQLKNNEAIHLDILEEIALDQLELGQWEFDYWLGENTNFVE